MKKKLSIGLAAVMTVSLLAGCSGGNAGQDTSSASTGNNETQQQVQTVEKKDVVIWHVFTDYQMEAFQKIVDEFNASQEEVNVIVQAQPYNDFDEKVMQAVRNGEGPDIILDYPSTVMNYLEEGLVTDLSTYVSDAEIGIEGFEESLSPAVYQEATQFGEGGLYVMPVVTTGPVFFYNKTLYDDLGLKAPETWDELVENCKVIKEKNGMRGFGFDELEDGAQILLMQNNAGYVDVDANKVTFNTEKAAEVFEWFAEQVNQDYFKLKPDDYFSTEFGAEAIASFIGSAAGYTYVVDAVGDKFEFATAPLPQGGEIEWSPAWNRGAIVFKSDEDTERAAYLFLKYFVSPEVNTQWCIDYEAISPYLAVNDSEKLQSYLKENPGLMSLSESLDTVGYIPAFRGSSTVRSELSKAIQEVSTGIKDASTALSDAEKVCNDEMSE